VCLDSHTSLSFRITDVDTTAIQMMLILFKLISSENADNVVTEHGSPALL
jgi:hypothetical protein